MPKDKSSNPADAFRKALKKKEQKKNKSERHKNREFALVKQDTSELEEEIAALGAKAERTAVEEARLKEVTADFERISKKKEDYVTEHPEHRKLVYRAKRRPEEEVTPVPAGPVRRNLFKKNGLPRHPERSLYYDAVMNPFGVAPPGMPYVERPLNPGEADSDQENKDSDEDIIMPEGPPPGEGDDEDSDDDIPMPEGPPPGQEKVAYAALGVAMIPPPPTMHPMVPPPPPPSGYPLPPPPSFPQHYPIPPPSTLPPLPAGFPMPPAPPGFFNRHETSGFMHDSLAGIPHKTYQAQPHPQPATLPPRPPSQSSPGVDNAVTAAATVFAEPELRDLKRESTAFMPASIKRKKTASGTSKLNAAPSVGTGEPSGSKPARPNLLSTLKEQFGTAGSNSKPSDYDKFLEEMGDIL